MTTLATICADQAQAQQQMQRLARIDRQYRSASCGAILPRFLIDQLNSSYDVQRVELERCANALARATAANDEPMPVGVA